VVGTHIPEWRSGEPARVLLRVKNDGEYETASGIVTKVADETAWVEFEHKGTEFNSRIPLHRLFRPESAFAGAKAALQRDADQFGGQLVEVECRQCTKPVAGHVLTDPGERASDSGPYVGAYLYVAGFVRDCNCNVERSDIERDLIVTAARVN
jgi:hypothetical protein